MAPLPNNKSLQAYGCPDDLFLRIGNGGVSETPMRHLNFFQEDMHEGLRVGVKQLMLKKFMCFLCPLLRLSDVVSFGVDIGSKIRDNSSSSCLAAGCGVALRKLISSLGWS